MDCHFSCFAPIQQYQLNRTVEHTAINLHQHVRTVISQCMVLYKLHTFRPDLSAALNFPSQFSNHGVVWVTVRLLSPHQARKLDPFENAHPSQNPATAVMLRKAIKETRCIRVVPSSFIRVRLGTTRGLVPPCLLYSETVLKTDGFTKGSLRRLVGP